MLFDLEPKSRREDLYDFEIELKDLINGIINDKIIVVRGLKEDWQDLVNESCT